ncbi:hypothetical protein ESCO_006618 [Escovopsis weberi]|uniref:Uncharacterized protein n=1 Tax=Escovopsis weberi TaxID=150374 RepID=A0A0M8N966_ESCWE|nr:hypothetical protein ESCO_006618 [Escovopsis weberi]
MALEDPDGPETPRSSISSEDSLGSHGSAEAEVVGAFGEIFDDLGDSLIHQVWKDLADVEETLEGTLEGNDIEDDLRDDGFFPGDSSSDEPGALVSEPLRDLHLGPPFCDADQSICDHLLRLRGRVASIRMAGFTEAYTHRFIAGLFPSASHVPIAQHAYRVSPSTAWPRISGQQSWVDHRGTRVLDDHDQVGDLPAGEFPEGPVPLPAPIVGEDGTATLPALRRPLLPRRLRVRVAVEPGDWIGDVSRYSWEAYYEDGDSSCASSVRSEPTMQLEREYPEGEGLSRSGYAHKRSFSI